MPGRLKEIVDFVEERDTRLRLKIARLSLQVGLDVTKITEDTPDDSELEGRMMEAAQRITGEDFIHKRR